MANHNGPISEAPEILRPPSGTGEKVYLLKMQRLFSASRPHGKGNALPPPGCISRGESVQKPPEKRSILPVFLHEIACFWSKLEQKSPCFYQFSRSGCCSVMLFPPALVQSASLVRSSTACSLRILVEVISDSGERDQVPRPRTLESVTLL